MTSDHHYIDIKPHKGLFGDDVDPFLHDEDDFSIAELIPRILLERKSFLNLTEESLLEEINTNGTPDPQADDVGPEIDTPPSTDEELEKLQALKLDLSKSINLALNETSLSLDFVSLLISSVKPNLAKSTISPHLAKTVPMGSLNADRLVKEPNEPNNDKDAASIGQGWKYDSLEKIKSLFKDSSAKLNQQVLKERTYWDMINKVLSNNEILMKMKDPSDNTKVIGVKYGYGDSGSSFHDKGEAILKKDDRTGELSFTPIVPQSNKLTGKVYKYVRVKILSQIDDDFMLTGQSKFDFNLDRSKKDKIIHDIEKARFFIFEEDLFYQLMREAKTLMNYNVSIISDKILIEIQSEIIEIEAVEYDESNEEELKNVYQNINKDSSKNNKKAQMILNFLKIMLCCYFKYNLSLKQKAPTNYTKFKQNNSHPLILRPLIGNIKHELYVKKMQSIVNGIIQTYRTQIQSEVEVLKYKNITSLSRIKDPFVKSVEKPVTEFIIKLKNNANGKYLKIDIAVTTSEIFVNLILNLKIIKFEKYENMNDNEKGINVLQLSFNDSTEIDQCLEWSIQKFLKE